MDYPDDRDVLEAFECFQITRFRCALLSMVLLYINRFVSYHFKHIAKTMRALQTSTKTSLRIDDEGLLSLQFLMPAPSLKSNREQTAAFTEFRVRQIMFLEAITNEGNQCLALDEDDV